jgi:hypothetical protein
MRHVPANREHTEMKRGGPMNAVDLSDSKLSLSGKQ